MSFFTIIAYQSSPWAYPKETDFLRNAKENVIIWTRRHPLKYSQKDSKVKLLISLETNVIRYILQFHQGVKRGKGIRVNPLNHVPAQVPESNHVFYSWRWLSSGGKTKEWDVKEQWWLTALSKRWAAGRCLPESSWSGYVVHLCWDKSPSRARRTVKQTTALVFHECKLCPFEWLTSPGVRSSDRSSAGLQSGCRTAPWEDAKKTFD